MTITAILAFIFILPGFLSYLVVQQYTVGFGKNTDTFDKTLITLLFDIPIFLITLKLFNWDYFIKLFNLSKFEFEGFKTFNQFSSLVDNDLNLLILLSIVALIVATLVGIVWVYLLKVPFLLKSGYYKFKSWACRKPSAINKITFYQNIWKSDFVKPSKVIPAELHSLSSGHLIAEGFIDEVSISLESDLEFKVTDQKLFSDLRKAKVMDDIKFTYINHAKDLRITVYKIDSIEEWVNEGRDHDEDER